MYQMKCVIMINTKQEQTAAFLALRRALQQEQQPVIFTDSVCKVIPGSFSGAICLTDSATVAQDLLSKGYAVLLSLGTNASVTETEYSIPYAVEALEEVPVSYIDNVFRRFHSLPWDILETDRLFIRESTVEDVSAFEAIYQDEEITRYTESLYPETEEKIYMQSYIRNMYGFFDYGIWTVIEKKSGQIIGRAGFDYLEESELPEIGFVIEKAWQRQGYAKECLLAICEYAQKELSFQRVQALVETENQVSLHLLTELHFQTKGTVLRKDKTYLLLEKEMESSQ